MFRSMHVLFVHGVSVLGTPFIFLRSTVCNSCTYVPFSAEVLHSPFFPFNHPNVDDDVDDRVAQALYQMIQPEDKVRHAS